MRKEGIALLLGFIALVICVVTGSVIKGREAPVPFQATESNFYIEQLNVQEKEIYEALAQQLLDFKPRVLELEAPITIHSACRISQALDLGDDRFFHYAMFLPIDKNGRALPLEDESVELWAIAPLTSSMLYLDRDGENFDYYILYDFDDSWQEHVGIDNINRLLQEGLTPQDVEKCRAMRQSLDQKLDEVIAGLPRDASRREAALYFCRWIEKNMVYDYPTLDYMNTERGDRRFSAETWEKTLYTNRTNAILMGSAHCGGFSQIARTLLQRVGIPAYIVQGNVPEGYHAWIKADFGEGYLVFDPTFYRGGWRHAPMSEEQLFKFGGHQKDATYFNY